MSTVKKYTVLYRYRNTGSSAAGDFTVKKTLFAKQNVIIPFLKHFLLLKLVQERDKMAFCAYY